MGNVTGSCLHTVETPTSQRFGRFPARRQAQNLISTRQKETGCGFAKETAASNNDLHNPKIRGG
ncbi:MAG: hypothetical protein Fur0032_21170 [Terrimicrobiaceae bacterium]